MRRFVFMFFIVFLVALLGLSKAFVYADELEEITNKLNELTKSMDESKKATAVNEQQLSKINIQLDGIKAQVNKIESDIVKKEQDIQEGEKRLKKQKILLDERVVSFYKNKGKEREALLQIIVTNNFPLFLKQFAYQQNLLDEDRSTIIRIALLIKDIEDKKITLEKEKQQLIPIKDQIAKQSTFLAGEVASAKSYQSQLQQQIVTLSAQQQQIISQRQASLNIPRSAGTSARGCSDDRNVDPGFSPRLAFFTYGAPHRNGLNQYGAFGRAKSGQNEEQILSEYYPGMSLKKDYDQNAQVNVDGYGSFSIEDYVKRIWEVPNNWGDEGGMAALKAQAVAARTYALNKMQRNGSICTTEACQVFRNEVKGGNWDAAVSATAGWVLMDGDKPGFTEYASTHGGYILNINKFDGSGGNPGNWSELNDRAYDKESPWFYCDWGARPEYNKTAWLKPDEVADIVNTLLLVKRDSGTAENLYQLDKSNPAGKDTWSADKVKSELRNKGGSPFNSISDISISADFGSGRATTVSVNGDAGSQSFSATEFKDRFNLRAPANLQIVGPLFNVEKR